MASNLYEILGINRDAQPEESTFLLGLTTTAVERSANGYVIGQFAKRTRRGHWRHILIDS